MDMETREGADRPMGDTSTRARARDGENPRERLDPEGTTVHEAIRSVSGADEVFRRFGIDSCCGGELTLAAAAEHHDVDLRRLLDALDGNGGES